jgi:hypothetical protein
MNHDPILIGTQNVTGALVAHQKESSFGTVSAQKGPIFPPFSRRGGAKKGTILD